MRQMLCALFLLLSAACPAVPTADQTHALPTVSSGRLERLSNFASRYVPARHVDIWLPAGFSPTQKYAVLYMHDGQMLFDARTSWNQQEWQVDEVAGLLQQQGKVRPFIVVAVHNGDHNRHAEYYPEQPFASMPATEQQRFYQLERSPGTRLFSQAVYSDAYLKFLVQELKPYIDQHYPVLTGPADTFIMGSSMGGLISWYALLSYPQVFGGAACLSTHWPGIFAEQNNPAPASFYRFLQQKLPGLTQQKIYYDYGDQTLDAWYPPLQQQVDQLMQPYPANQWQSRFFAGAAHTEQAWAKRLDQPLLFLLGNQRSRQQAAQ